MTRWAAQSSALWVWSMSNMQYGLYIESLTKAHEGRGPFNSFVTFFFHYTKIDYFFVKFMSWHSHTALDLSGWISALYSLRLDPPLQCKMKLIFSPTQSFVVRFRLGLTEMAAAISSNLPAPIWLFLCPFIPYTSLQRGVWLWPPLVWGLCVCDCLWNWIVVLMKESFRLPTPPHSTGPVSGLKGNLPIPTLTW